jgi:hypothetical protein
MPRHHRGEAVDPGKEIRTLPVTGLWHLDAAFPLCLPGTRISGGPHGTNTLLPGHEIVFAPDAFAARFGRADSFARGRGQKCVIQEQLTFG